MTGPDTASIHPEHRDPDTMDHRIAALEKGIRVWRCLTAAGFLTALGAFWLAVFGLGQLENTYFIGEMVLSGSTHSPSLGTGDEVEVELVEREGVSEPAHDPPVQVSQTLEGLAMSIGTHDRTPGPASPAPTRDR